MPAWPAGSRLYGGAEFCFLGEGSAHLEELFSILRQGCGADW
jgi:hypothetical protein